MHNNFFVCKTIYRAKLSEALQNLASAVCARFITSTQSSLLVGPTESDAELTTVNCALRPFLLRVHTQRKHSKQTFVYYQMATDEKGKYQKKFN